jgi:electron transfer flavoprotein alpha subunit
MSVLVFAENSEGRFKKAAFEGVAFASAIAGGSVTAVVLGNMDAAHVAELGKFGASKVLHYSDASFNAMDAGVFAQVISDAASKVGAQWVIISNTYTGKAVAPRVAVRLNAAFAPGIIALPEGNTVKRSVFSNKGFADFSLNQSVKVVSLTPNSYSFAEGSGTAEVESCSFSPLGNRVTVKEVKKAAGKVPLTEAEVVVSGGRGLKGPENWHLIENLADTLNAATACSKPVSDVHWRPHSEHVGQTGITIKPNLYIACGISGAIQHLAGVSSSKVIVAINTDKEAPFFKAADYGVVGDVFDVLPRLNEAIKAFKNS